MRIIITLACTECKQRFKKIIRYAKRLLHFDHFGEQKQTQRGFDFVGMDKTGLKFPSILLCFKEFTDRPLKLRCHIKTGELIGVHKAF